MILEIVSFAAIGVLAGVLSGLIGIGGGVVTIPCLLLVFKFLDIPPSVTMHLAIGTSLAAMVFTTLSATYSHYKRGGILFPIVKPMSLGIIVGALVGAMIARILPGGFLQSLFGLFEVALGIYFLFPEKKIKPERSLPRFWILSMIALGVSTFAAMLGIGGGLITVPILTYFQLPVKKAIGTSAALSFLISLFGALSFLFLGMHASHVDDAVGYLYMPAFIIISSIAFFAARYGTQLAHRLPTSILRRVFGIALLLAGAMMLPWGAIMGERLR